MKLLIVLLSLFVTNLYAQSNVADVLEDQRDEIVANGKLIDKLADLDIKFSTDILDIDLLDGINISSKYRYEVEDSYQHAYYSRVDKWDVSASINPGDLIKDLGISPFSFSIEKNQSIYFSRQFKSKSEAMKAMPYTPKKIPFNANTALNGLNVGDFVSLPGQLNLVVSANLGLDITPGGPLEANAGAYWIISGEFTIQIYKVDEKRVRLKLLSTNGNTKGTNVGIKPSFDIFGVKIIDKQIKKILNLNKELLNVDFAKRFGNQFIVDYVFDLSDEQARIAYNQILSSAYKFKDIKSMGQVDNIQDIEDKMLTSYDIAEAVYAEDLLVERKNKRVSRIFKGFTKSNSNLKKLKVNVLVVKHEKESTYSNKKITYINEFNEQLDFLYPTYTKFRESKLGRGGFYLQDQVYHHHFALMSLRSNGQDDKRDPDLGVSFHRKDKLITKNEIGLIENFINGQVPNVITKNIDFSQWSDGSRNKSAQVKFDVILKSAGLNHIPNYSQSQIKELLKRYIKNTQDIDLINPKNTKWETVKDISKIQIGFRLTQINEMSSMIYEALKQRGHDPKKLSDLIIELNKYNQFNEVGVGFLISLLPKDKLAESIYVKLTMSLEEAKEIDVTFGELENKALYDQLDQIQSRILSNSYDLRL